MPLSHYLRYSAKAGPKEPDTLPSCLQEALPAPVPSAYSLRSSASGVGELVWRGTDGMQGPSYKGGWEMHLLDPQPPSYRRAFQTGVVGGG